MIIDRQDISRAEMCYQNFKQYHCRNWPGKGKKGCQALVSIVPDPVARCEKYDLYMAGEARQARDGTPNPYPWTYGNHPEKRFEEDIKHSLPCWDCKKKSNKAVAAIDLAGKAILGRKKPEDDDDDYGKPSSSTSVGGSSRPGRR